MRRTVLAGVVCAVLSLGLLAAVAWAAEFHVNSTEDRPAAAPGDGRCVTGLTLPDGTPECTLRAAVQAADALTGEQTIIVPSGTYVLTASTLSPDDEDARQLAAAITPLDAAATGDLDIGTDIFVGRARSVAIRGEGLTPPVIDGNAADRVFDVMGDVGLTLENLVIQNGLTHRNGAGIRISSAATVQLTDLAVQGNQADPAFGLGGGLWIAASGVPQITRCTFRNNSAAGGGGIFYASASGRLQMLDSTVTGNTAHSIQHVYDGGGFAMYSPYGVGTAYISNCTFSLNSAALHGGGLALLGATFMTNVTVSGNEAGSLGGGIFVTGAGAAGAPLAILGYGTIAHNTAAVGGGVASPTRGLGMNHTILAGNRSTAVGFNNCQVSSVTSGGYNLESENSCALSTPTDLHDTDPLLAPLADNSGPTWTHALLAGSPAIDSGIPTLSLSPWDLFPFPMDQRGVRRPQGRATDRGAYEAAFPLIATIPVRIPLRLSPLSSLLAFLTPTTLVGDPTARILDVQIAKGIDGAQVTIGKDRRSAVVETTLSRPLEGGTANGQPRPAPLLFTVRVQKSARTPLTLMLEPSEFDTRIKTRGGPAGLLDQRQPGIKAEAEEQDRD